MSIKLAVIGGTGLDLTNMITDREEIEVFTSYGKALVNRGMLAGVKILFMYRHGQEHTIPPHRINYRANIAALRKLGANAIIASAAVGSIRKEYSPGDLVLPDQFIDFTKARHHTFFDEPGRVVHTDMTEPFCPGLRSAISTSAGKMGTKIHSNGTYVCVEGPRFETAAEIKAYALLGGDLTGMTVVPEIILAREAGICYAAIAIVTNYGAGLSATLLTHREVCEMMSIQMPRLSGILRETIASPIDIEECACTKSVDIPEDICE
ncbi:MAG: S-methyl-5'-thioadenosine phosphorylase [bacterium]|jgi:5'-methylthioadenosine phosphorylase|nr:S-methyl-5'-thioadenosine phosphorylase [bacterium]MDD3804797.1 S-methyl-5'-thioadenosine phosphorylase [bacterium]MDD4153351.1 S-methyl-5'-thioadenosine phosphorylase [bacterium]MDD4558151.1 S-methyl-5'-thioadenosine phosphorylase [bacterium]